MNLWVSEVGRMHGFIAFDGSIWTHLQLWENRAANKLPPVSSSRIEFLRHIRDFFQIMFKMDVQKPLEDERKGGDKVLMTCVGVGYSNVNKTLK